MLSPWAKATTVTLSYDATRNRMSQSADTGGSGMASTGTRTVAYDGRGNVTTLGTLGFFYDMADQPRAVSGASNGTYAYDGNLRRVKAIVDGKTIYNVFDLSGSLVHIDKLTGGGQTAAKTDYVSGPSGTLARITNNVVTFLHNDPVGSASTGTSATGATLWTERYTPFGEAMLQPSANDDVGGYTGHIRDAATGLNYMQARYQDPVSGRFLSVDPIGFMETGEPGMVNRYAYTLNDPINLLDPDGLHPQDVMDDFPDSTSGSIVEALSDFVTGIAESLGETFSSDDVTAGEEVGGVTATEEDEADSIFDPDAGPNELPKNEEEANEIRDAVRGDWGGEAPEVSEEDIKDSKHQGEEKMRYDSPYTGNLYHYYRNTQTGATSHGKVKKRPLVE